MPTYNKGFSDLSLDFTAHPVTGDVAKVKDTTSVKRGIRNVLLTENGERLFNPELGSGVRNLLFEPDIDVDNLNERINQQIQYYIPEITLLDTIVNYIEDKQTLYITVSYSVDLDGTTDAVQLNFNY